MFLAEAILDARFPEVPMFRAGFQVLARDFGPKPAYEQLTRDEYRAQDHGHDE